VKAKDSGTWKFKTICPNGSVIEACRDAEGVVHFSRGGVSYGRFIDISPKVARYLVEIDAEYDLYKVYKWLTIADSKIKSKSDVDLMHMMGSLLD